jgi:hypothetical protein
MSLREEMGTTIARFAPDESGTPLLRAARAGRVLMVTAGSACTARPAGLRLRRSRRSRRWRNPKQWARAHRDDVTSGEGRCGHGRH